MFYYINQPLTPFFPIGLPGIFPNIFYCFYLVLKTQSSIGFHNSIFYLFHFNNSFHCTCRSSILNTLSTRKAVLRKIYFQCFYSGSEFSSNLAVFKLQNFYSLSWAFHGGTLSATKKNKQEP